MSKKEHPAVKRFIDLTLKNFRAICREIDAVDDAKEPKEREHHQQCLDALNGIYHHDMEVMGQIHSIDEFYEKKGRFWRFIAFCALGFATGVVVGFKFL